MKAKDRFIQHYENGYMPWAHEKADFNLVETISSWNIKPGKTLEIGCGTGTDAIWLSQQGFDIYAIDVSPIAIRLATENAAKADVVCRFEVKDFLDGAIAAKPFDLVFDRGYFHTFHSHIRRKTISKKIASVLRDDGLWLTLVGSTDTLQRDSGPPQRSARNIIAATEPFFEIQFLKASVFGNEQDNPSKNWVCLMKKRN